MLTCCDGESRMRLGGGGGVREIFAEIIGWLFACHVAIGLQCCHSPPSATLLLLEPILLWSLRAFSQFHPLVNNFLCSLVC